jgi:UDP-N-acetylmuramate: L-alanyl-gamma-D-glutamyl-meso-diaminopimelate ligase
MRIHLIATGGAVMHNLAIALHLKGYNVTGSDDEIFDPAKSRLMNYGLLPEKCGWSPENINPGIDVIILGMHARSDNPELIRAIELGLKIFSFPEYLYEQSKNKIRVVIGGSHGKTTITSMIMHVLKFNGYDFDYMVGSQLEGFDNMVRITDNAPIALFEGDEYLSSAIDTRPKFHLYKPHIALLSGIAWDHINVFPTFGNYIEQFRQFIRLIEPDGSLIYNKDDDSLNLITKDASTGLKLVPYTTIPFTTTSGVVYLKLKNKKYPLQVFGEHNLQNISGARLVCNEMGLNDEQFFKAITSFRGAARRLQLLGRNENTNIYLDFAHSPSKLKATIKAVKQQFPERQLVACMELHTFSSLNKEFLPEYYGTLLPADSAFIYFNPHTLEHKGLQPFTTEEVSVAFGGENLKVFTDADQLLSELLSLQWAGKNLLMMSSGNFSGTDMKELVKKILC